MAVAEGMLSPRKDRAATSSRSEGATVTVRSLVIGLALAVSILRLRLSWWPLHPLIFLVWGTYAMARLSGSFLLGWMVRTVTVRIGGGAAYRVLVAFMVGVIAGDVLGLVGNMLVGVIYYLLTGLAPSVPAVF